MKVLCVLSLVLLPMFVLAQDQSEKTSILEMALGCTAVNSLLASKVEQTGSSAQEIEFVQSLIENELRWWMVMLEAEYGKDKAFELVKQRAERIVKQNDSDAALMDDLFTFGKNCALIKKSSQSP